MKVGKSLRHVKSGNSHFEISALLRDNAKSGDDNGASQSKLSSRNGAVKPSDNDKSEKDNGASQSTDYRTLKHSESSAQVSFFGAIKKATS